MCDCLARLEEFSKTELEKQFGCVVDKFNVKTRLTTIDGPMNVTYETVKVIMRKVSKNGNVRDTKKQLYFVYRYPRQSSEEKTILKDLQIQ